MKRVGVKLLIMFAPLREDYCRLCVAENTFRWLPSVYFWPQRLTLNGGLVVHCLWLPVCVCVCCQWTQEVGTCCRPSVLWVESVFPPLEIETERWREIWSVPTEPAESLLSCYVSDDSAVTSAGSGFHFTLFCFTFTVTAQSRPNWSGANVCQDGKTHLLHSAWGLMLNETTCQSMIWYFLTSFQKTHTS